MTSPEYQIGVAVENEDQMVVIKPPVDTAFREEIFDVLEREGLIKEVVVRDGFFETKHLPNGEPYSELRIATTALEVASQRMINIAHMSAKVLQGQQKTAQVDPYLQSLGGDGKLFR